MAEYAISPVTNVSMLSDYLHRDLGIAAYALGDLDEPHFSHTSWLAASRTGTIEAIAMVYDMPALPVLFLMGPLPALCSILFYDPGPAVATYLAPVEVSGEIVDYYDVHHQDEMLRMRITSGTYVSLAGSDERRAQVARFTRQHHSRIQELLSTAASHDEREDSIVFDADMLDDGFYFGVEHGTEILAVAGTHLVSERQKIATIGNIAVHPRARRMGLGSLVTDMVTDAVLRAGFTLVVLNVRKDNGPAIKIYRKLGYRVVGEFIEGTATRRSIPTDIRV